MLLSSILREWQLFTSDPFKGERVLCQIHEKVCTWVLVSLVQFWSDFWSTFWSTFWFKTFLWFSSAMLTVIGVWHASLTTKCEKIRRRVSCKTFPLNDSNRYSNGFPGKSKQTFWKQNEFLQQFRSYIVVAILFIILVINNNEERKKKKVGRRRWPP